MRVFFVIALFVFTASIARSDESTSDESTSNESTSDESTSDESVPWRKPFEPISASQETDALVLVLITNEDPFSLAETTNEQVSENELAAGSSWKPPVWCADVLEQAYRKALVTRADLRGRIVVQSIAAGLPKELTGGTDVNKPARAVLAICDGHYRLLSFMVGVPDGEDLLTLIEDAEDVAIVRGLQEGDQNRLVDSIAQRSRERLSRLWRGVLDESIDAMDGDRGGGDEDASGQERSSKMQMWSLAEALDPTYLADVRLRFGLTDQSDATRLIILEQHPEARRPWCDAMTPFTAGCDFPETWRTLVELIWGFPPITADAEANDLIDWFDLHIETDSVVLGLTPSLRLQHVAWPPVSVSGASRRGVGWQKVHSLATLHPFRNVDAQQLATLIHSRDLVTVDLRQPTVARYLFIEPRKRRTHVVREGDPPGRFAGILKRSQSSFVKE